MRQNPGSGTALGNKAYEERVKMPTQRDSLDEAAMKVSLGKACVLNSISYFCHTFVSSTVVIQIFVGYSDLGTMLGNFWIQIMHRC